MSVIPISEAEAGMVLAADVVDRRGRVLIPLGAELSERTVQALGNWGIETIHVEGEEIEIDDEAMNAAMAAVGWRFAKNDVSHPFMAALVAEAAKAHAQSAGAPTAAEAIDASHA